MGDAGARRTIFINGRFLEQPLSGVQRYAREMLSALDRTVGTVEVGERWILLTTANERDCPPLRRIQKCVDRSGLRGHAWEQLVLGRAARGGLILGFCNSGPVFHPRQLVIIHDAAVFRHPEFYSTRYALWHRLLDRALASRARIGTSSHFSREELARVLRLDPGGIPVFSPGFEHLARLSPSFDAYDRLRLRDRTYFVTLGSLTANKNLALAVEASKRLPNVLLVVIGSADERVFASDLHGPRSDRLVFAGRIDDANVRGLLSNAAALLFPSFYEGFGFPPLEAMASGCPVIASDIAPVRELCGDAAFYFDPHSVEQLSAAMHTILNETAAGRHERVRRGIDRAGIFSWDDSARQLADFCRNEILVNDRLSPAFGADRHQLARSDST
jgi:glycosyltransferase involved in cell wall biosynthesis